jgi:transposase-like protein
MLGFGPQADRQARREWWRRQIERQKDSQRTVADFCRRLGVSTVTFYGWKRKLREAPTAAPRPATNGAAPPSRATATGAIASFVPVSIRDTAAIGQLEIELANACIVRLQGTVDPKLLHVAIRAAGRLGEIGKGGD